MLFKLLALPVSAPLSGVRFCLNQLVEMAEQEMLDDAPVREALLLLTLQVEEGDIDDVEYVVREAELLQQLRGQRRWRGRGDSRPVWPAGRGHKAGVQGMKLPADRPPGGRPR